MLAQAALGGSAVLKEAGGRKTTMKKGQFGALGRTSFRRLALPSVDLAPEANRSADLVEWAQVSFIMKKKKNLIFHFPFLIEKYAWVFPGGFLVKGRIVVEPKFLGAAALRESNFNLNGAFRAVLGSGLLGSGNKAAGLLTVP